MTKNTKLSEMSIDTVEQINTSAMELITALETAGKAMVDITKRLNDIQAMTTIDDWVRTWGETLNKKEAAKMLGISVGHLNKLIGEGVIQISPDKRVLVRSAAKWAQGYRPVRPKASTRWRVKA